MNERGSWSRPYRRPLLRTGPSAYSSRERWTQGKGPGSTACPVLCTWGPVHDYQVEAARCLKGNGLCHDEHLFSVEIIIRGGTLFSPRRLRRARRMPRYCWDNKIRKDSVRGLHHEDPEAHEIDLVPLEFINRGGKLQPRIERSSLCELRVLCGKKSEN